MTSRSQRRARTHVALLVVAVALAHGCHRTQTHAPSPDAGVGKSAGPNVLCVEQSDGCLLCDDGRDSEAAFLDPEEPRPLLCNPKDDEECVEYCSRVVAPCAAPWTAGPRCKLGSELEWRRAVFLRDAAGSAEAQLVGRVIDDAGKRIEGARIRVWVSGAASTTPLFDEVSSRDGTFRLKLPLGAWTYSMRISYAGKATELVDKLPLDRADRSEGRAGTASSAGATRTYHLGDELALKGRVTDGASGEPIADATVEAVRGLDDAVPLGEARSGVDGTFTLGGLEARRYQLRVTKFGWKSLVTKATPVAGGPRVQLKLGRAAVIRGVVLDDEGAPETNATVAALLSGPAGAPNLPILWTTDGEGAFAQDRFAPGPYYVWARRGEMLSYPPEKIELSENRETELKLVLGHKGARVKGQVRPYPGTLLAETRARVLLVNRSPLALPRPAVGEVRGGGAFTLSGLAPGRYEIVIRDGLRTLGIVEGPRVVEVPIEPDSTVTLDGVIVVRGGLED